MSTKVDFMLPDVWNQLNLLTVTWQSS